MKMNIPCRVLKTVKRYAITTEDSLRKNKPKVHVSASRHRRTKAPDTHDLRRATKTTMRDGGHSARGEQLVKISFAYCRINFC